MEEPEANCVRNGLHAAKNPLDCLTYYDWDSSVCYVVEIGGDIDEDAVDSKVSCTRIRLDRQLNLSQFVAHACWYILQHAHLKDNSRVQYDSADLVRNRCEKRKFAIVRGKDPKARGLVGDVIGLVQEEEGSKDIKAAGAFVIDGIKYHQEVWYDAWGQEVKE